MTASINGHVHHIFSSRFTVWDANENTRSFATVRDVIRRLPSNDSVFAGGDYNAGIGRSGDSNDLLPAYLDFVGQTRLRPVMGGMGWEFPSPDDHLLVRGPYFITQGERRNPDDRATDHPWVLGELLYLHGLHGVPLHDGSLLHQESNHAIYVIFGGAKFWVPDPETLQRLYGGYSHVQVVAASLDAVPTVPCNGTVLREEHSAHVWLIQNRRRRHITSPDVLARFGGWDAVRIVYDNATANFPLGDPVV